MLRDPYPSSRLERLRDGYYSTPDPASSCLRCSALLKTDCDVAAVLSAVQSVRNGVSISIYMYIYARMYVKIKKLKIGEQKKNKRCYAKSAVSSGSRVLPREEHGE